MGTVQRAGGQGGKNVAGAECCFVIRVECGCSVVNTVSWSNVQDRAVQQNKVTHMLFEIL